MNDDKWVMENDEEWGRMNDNNEKWMKNVWWGMNHEGGMMNEWWRAIKCDEG
jgi:hypothetical protein